MARQKHTYKRRNDRLNDIVLAALGQWQGRGVKTFTMYKMAKWLGLAPSNHLKKMIDELYLEGWFTRTEKYHRGNVAKHVYKLSAFAKESAALL